MATYITVDIGGTQLRAARFSGQGTTPDEVIRTPTKSKDSAPLDRLIKLIADAWPTGEQVQAIGVAVPGPTDPYQGVVIEAPNIPGWNDLPLRQILEERFQTPVALGNDANMAALGEWRYGAGSGSHDLLYLTVSTGIGSGVIMRDRLLLGARGLAGELGHLTVMPDGPMCGCGQRGHLEALASGTALLGWVKEQLAAGATSILAEENKISGLQITRAAELGDGLAIKALDRCGTYVGIALASFLHIFNPSVVVIGGGVSRSGDFLMKPLHLALESHVMNHAYLEGLKIYPALYGDEVGLVGALALIRELHPE